MSRIDGPGKDATPLASERRRVLDALGGEVLTGPAVLRRMRGRPIGAEAGAEAGAADRVDPGDESLLYPAIYSLEADWKLKAICLPDGNGRRHRTYRKRRLLPRGPG